MLPRFRVVREMLGIGLDPEPKAILLPIQNSEFQLVSEVAIFQLEVLGSETWAFARAASWIGRVPVPPKHPNCTAAAISRSLGRCADG